MRLRQILLAVMLLILSAATLAYALGADHTGPVGGTNHWPQGLKDLANRPNRVHGYFVNSQDVFFYTGNTDALNDFLKEYAALKNTSLLVVLHPGRKPVSSPWDKTPRGLFADWTLHTGNEFELNEQGQLQVMPFETRVDIWLGGKVILEELDVPAVLPVRSGGEIEAFIMAHEQRRGSSREKDKPLNTDQSSAE